MIRKKGGILMMVFWIILLALAAFAAVLCARAAACKPCLLYTSPLINLLNYFRLLRVNENADWFLNKTIWYISHG